MGPSTSGIAPGTVDKPLAFGGIQMMRGVAAVMVMMGHGLNGLFPFYDRIFPSGVDIFFVISGFIISYSATSARIAGRTSSAFRFATRRIIRIFPLYWIVLGCAFLTNERVHFCAGHLKLATVLLDDPTACFVTPAWTLCFEVQFYAFMCAAIFLARRYIFELLLLFMLPVIVVHGFKLPINDVVTNPLVLEFGFGAFIAYCARRDAKRFGVAAAVLSIVFFGAGATIATGVGAGAVNGMTRVATYGFGAALLIYGVMTADLRGVRFPAFARYIGDASYSIYIWHIVLIIWWWAAIVPDLSLYIHGLSLAAIRLGTMFVGTILLYEVVERPMLRAMRRGGDRSVDAAIKWARKMYPRPGVAGASYR